MVEHCGFWPIILHNPDFTSRLCHAWGGVHGYAKYDQNGETHAWKNRGAVAVLFIVRTLEAVGIGSLGTSFKILNRLGKNGKGRKKGIWPGKGLRERGS